MTVITKSIQYGKHQLTLETGLIARQATAAVMATMGDTMVLVTVVSKASDGEPKDFFPLTVNYQEKFYAGGRIPGGYFKREGRPTEKETLISRLIDRPIRPLFPKGFYNEVQLIATVLSIDPDVSSDIVSMIGASAALAIAGLPFQGPIGAARVGYKNNEFILNPSKDELVKSELDLVVAGTATAVLMVESEAKELPEDTMLEAVMFGHKHMQPVIQLINEFASAVGGAQQPWSMLAVDDNLRSQIAQEFQARFEEAYQIREKQLRYQRLDEIRDTAMEKYVNEENELHSPLGISTILDELEQAIVRNAILQGKPRIDGRDTTTVRPIMIKTGILPRAHGSALFQRGETQALVVTTLGSGRDAQLNDDVEGETKDNFLFNYNFPPYCVGETGMFGSPKRREIGHGRLAKRGVLATMPAIEEFPYVVRVVSEITESNGSSSMASVCGASLALMDAGVPVKAPVAGIAMGLIKEGEKFAVLTDILGDEDHLGDMDFKVAGTEKGITALQMDIKIDGITREIMDTALKQANAGRRHILAQMANVLAKPKEAVSSYAPRIMKMSVPSDKVRDVIGKGGATIKGIIENTGVNIDITDDGTIVIAAPNVEAGQKAMDQIKTITMTLELNTVYTGVVAKIVDFGAFINFPNGQSGLLHISQISHERVENVSDYLKEGQQVPVKILEVDRQGRMKLTAKLSDNSSVDNQS